MGRREFAAGFVAEMIDCDALIEAARNGRLRAKHARPESPAAKRLLQGGALAAILGLEGCVPIGGGDLFMAAPKPKSPPPPPPDPASGKGGAVDPAPHASAPPPPPAPPEEEAHHSDEPSGDGSVVSFPPDAHAEEDGAHADDDGGDNTDDRPEDSGPADDPADDPGQSDDGGAHGGDSSHDDDHGGDDGDDAAPGDDHDDDCGCGDDDHHHDDPPTGTPHPDDPKKRAEHEALLNLVPAAEATHIAVKDGSWFDPSIWANGEVPGEGARVLIPSGRHVDYDGQSDVSIFTIRVDGHLTFATDRDTFLEVDTFVVAPSGELTIGTAANPVRADVETVISIAANGAIDTGWDPMLLSRGLIGHGSVEIHGAEKESFLRVAADPMAGATAITLETAAEGWRVGDRIVIAGTHLTQTGDYQQDQPRTADSTEDEVRIITAIDGATVRFDQPLQFNHEGARADLKTYVANYTRNVRIESEGGAATPVHQRGHVMLMHSDDVDVRYAEFHELGRTDKSTRAFDLDDLSSVSPDSNLKGRYSLHIHRAGVGEPMDPAMIVGNSVWGSPGWGFVHHDSNAILAGNAAFDVFGAAFVAETGNETGRWVDNISIKTLGVFTGPKDQEDVVAFDLGRGGVGFWFQGRLVDAVDNVAAGSPGGHGFVYMTRHPEDELRRIDPATVQNGEKLRYVDEAYPYTPNIAVFHGNEAFAVDAGLEIIKPNQEQNNDSRTLLDEFTAWEVRAGVILQYTAHYTLTDIDLVSTAQTLRHYAGPNVGLDYTINVFDIVVNRANIEGFDTGARLMRWSQIEGVTDFQYVFVDTNFNGNDTNVLDLMQSGSGFAADRFLTSADLRSGALSYASSLGSVIDGPDTWMGEPWVELRGLKTDSLGEVATSTVWDPFRLNYWNIRGAVEQNGYWTLNDGRKVTLIEEYVADRATGATEKFALWIEIPSAMSLNPNDPGAPRVEPLYHGVLDPNNADPIASADHAIVKAGTAAVIDVLANDRDPEGDALLLDAIWSDHGHVIAGPDGKVSYFADPDFEGEDSFYYWTQDDSGNFAKAQVTVTVEI